MIRLHNMYINERNLVAFRSREGHHGANHQIVILFFGSNIEIDYDFEDLNYFLGDLEQLTQAGNRA